MTLTDVLDFIQESSNFPIVYRVDIFNAIQRELGKLVEDFAPDPACSPQLIPSDRVLGNDYNPNKVAATELDLLEQSMRADGITMAVVVMPQEQAASDLPVHPVIDGFHRRTVASERLKRPYIPCAVLNRNLADRMASTVRHNRARGKHNVELMGELVKSMIRLGVPDDQVAKRLGMSLEELLRLKQTVGAASLLSATEYGRAWEGRDGSDPTHT